MERKVVFVDDRAEHIELLGGGLVVVVTCSAALMSRREGNAMAVKIEFGVFFDGRRIAGPRPTMLQFDLKDSGVSYIEASRVSIGGQIYKVGFSGRAQSPEGNRLPRYMHVKIECAK